MIYIPTPISLWNHVSQFNNTVRPVVLLAHVEKLLLKIFITYFYVYCIYVESLCDKVLIFFCLGYLVKKIVDMNYFAI